MKRIATVVTVTRAARAIRGDIIDGTQTAPNTSNGGIAASATKSAGDVTNERRVDSSLISIKTLRVTSLMSVSIRFVFSLSYQVS